MGGAANDETPQRRKCAHARSLSGGLAPPPKAEGAWEPLLEREHSEWPVDNRTSDFLSEVAASSSHQHIVLTSRQFYRLRSL